MISVKRITADSDIRELKEMYIQSLNGLLESSIEEFIEYDADTFLIEYGDEIIGYYCIDKKGTIQQFYITDDYIKIGTEVLHFLIKEKYGYSALVTTRDRYFLSICLELHKELSVNAYLFEDAKEVAVELPSFKNLDFRLADLEDMDLIKEVCGDFYDYLHYTLEDSIKKREIFVLYSNKTLLGTGSVVTKKCNPPYAEIGMCVNESYRSNNIGTYILLQS